MLATSFDAGPFLFRNLGDGRFADVSVQAGIRTQAAAYTPVFFDYDNDGSLDLFVCTYPDGDLTVNDMIKAKISGATVPRAQRQLLFHNNGDGTFRNVTEEAGITGWYGGMSSQVGDFETTASTKSPSAREIPRWTGLSPNRCSTTTAKAASPMSVSPPD